MYDWFSNVNLVLTQDAADFLELAWKGDASSDAYLEDVMGIMNYPSDLAEFKMVLENMMNDWMATFDEESEDDRDDST
jgi:hypothetical protein